MNKTIRAFLFIVLCLIPSSPKAYTPFLASVAIMSDFSSFSLQGLQELFKNHPFATSIFTFIASFMVYRLRKTFPSNPKHIVPKNNRVQLPGNKNILYDAQQEKLSLFANGAYHSKSRTKESSISLSGKILCIKQKCVEIPLGPIVQKIISQGTFSPINQLSTTLTTFIDIFSAQTIYEANGVLTWQYNESEDQILMLQHQPLSFFSLLCQNLSGFSQQSSQRKEIFKYVLFDITNKKIITTWSNIQTAFFDKNNLVIIDNNGRRAHYKPYQPCGIIQTVQSIFKKKYYESILGPNNLTIPYSLCTYDDQNNEYTITINNKPYHRVSSYRIINNQYFFVQYTEVSHAFTYNEIAKNPANALINIPQNLINSIYGISRSYLFDITTGKQIKTPDLSNIIMCSELPDKNLLCIQENGNYCLLNSATHQWEQYTNPGGLLCTCKEKENALIVIEKEGSNNALHKPIKCKNSDLDHKQDFITTIEYSAQTKNLVLDFLSHVKPYKKVFQRVESWDFLCNNNYILIHYTDDAIPVVNVGFEAIVKLQDTGQVVKHSTKKNIKTKLVNLSSGKEELALENVISYELSDNNVIHITYLEFDKKIYHKFYNLSLFQNAHLGEDSIVDETIKYKQDLKSEKYIFTLKLADNEKKSFENVFMYQKFNDYLIVHTMVEKAKGLTNTTNILSNQNVHPVDTISEILSNDLEKQSFIVNTKTGEVVDTIKNILMITTDDEHCLLLLKRKKKHVSCIKFNLATKEKTYSHDFKKIFRCLDAKILIQNTKKDRITFQKKPSTAEIVLSRATNVVNNIIDKKQIKDNQLQKLPIVVYDETFNGLNYQSYNYVAKLLTSSDFLNQFVVSPVEKALRKGTRGFICPLYDFSGFAWASVNTLEKTYEKSQLCVTTGPAKSMPYNRYQSLSSILSKLLVLMETEHYKKDIFTLIIENYSASQNSCQAINDEIQFCAEKTSIALQPISEMKQRAWPTIGHLLSPHVNQRLIIFQNNKNKQPHGDNSWTHPITDGDLCYKLVHKDFQSAQSANKKNLTLLAIQ